MFYVWDITIPADTSEDNAKTQNLPISIGVITRISIKFARGCHGMVGVRLNRFLFQLVPLSAGEWVTGDNEAVDFQEYFEIKEVPPVLVFKGCSPGTSYAHTVTVRISLLPKRVASMIPIIELLTRLLQRMGVFR